ncbi:MAG: hypothetical protein WCC69_12380 [Pirellulales bacterium]
MNTVELTRQELYDLVWETPTRHLCKRFGLSDVGLAKVCKRLEIPRPSYGYWAKKAAGGQVKRTPLPQCDDQQLQRVAFTPGELKTEEDDGFFDAEMRALYEQESQADPIEVSESLRSPHSLVARTRDALARVKPSTWSRDEGLLYPDRQEGVHLLDIACSKATLPRALRVMDALLKGLERRGFSFGEPKHSWHHGTAATGHGYEFVFRMREPTKRQLRPKKNSWDSQYAYVLTGELQLEIDYMTYRSNRVFRDGVHKKVEDYVRELPLKMLQVIDEYRRKEAERAEVKRREDEIRQRQREEADRKARREAQLQKRRERREALLQTAEQWRRVQTLREFIEAVRATAIERAGGTKLHPDTMRWLDWAQKAANLADPIEQMKRDSDRRKARQKPK